MDTSHAHYKKIGLPGLIAGGLAIFGLLFIIIEGLASYGLLVRDVMRTSLIAERRHTKYDPDLGWVNEPNVYIPDMYGPGVYLRTNAQGFRSNQNINAAVPDGKARVICSGDSFTLGFGVDNDHTWCQLLSLLEPRLETVNMGQGGYGVDQAYLWYKRDAARIEHQVHLLAFITHDFYRVQSDSFLGYAKPALDVANGALVVKNVPVPRRSYYLSWITQSIEKLRRLRTVELSTRFIQKIRHTAVASRQPLQGKRNDKTREVLRKIFEDLKRIDEQRSSKLVLVYLPTIDELKGGGPQDWTEFLEEEARALGIPLINLFREFRSLPYDEIGNQFIPKGQLAYQHAEGHFNVAGNELVAKMIYEQLTKQPAISCALSVRLLRKLPGTDHCQGDNP
jgi:hypothetical protein